jgi:histidinol-phosphatase (PHP family)
MLADFHTHTRFSGDSEAEPQAVLDAACALGMEYFCFTDHQDFDYNYDDMDFNLPVEDYWKTMPQLKENYNGKLFVSIGVETGLEPHLGERLHEFVKANAYDFVIGSCHLLHGVDPYYPEFWRGKTDRQALEEYFQIIRATLDTCHDFDVYGHLDYIIRYSPNGITNYNPADYLEQVDDIFKKLIYDGKGIEANSGGMYKGAVYPNPHPLLLKRYRQLGGEIITVGSDAHTPDKVGYGFSQLAEYLKEAGFQYYCVFQNRKAKFLPL